MIVPQVRTLIKIPSGGAKLAPISVSALKLQLGQVQNEPVILCYLLSIIFDGLYRGHKITVRLARESVTFSLLPHPPMQTTHKNRAY